MAKDRIGAANDHGDPQSHAYLTRSRTAQSRRRSNSLSQVALGSQQDHPTNPIAIHQSEANVVTCTHISNANNQRWQSSCPAANVVERLTKQMRGLRKKRGWANLVRFSSGRDRKRTNFPYAQVGDSLARDDINA